MALDPNIPLRMPQQPTFAEQAGQAFQLADVVEKQRAMQQQRADSTNLQQYLKEGGNLDTPEGIAKAAEWAKGNLSPSGYQTIVSAGQEMRANEQKRIEALAKADTAQLDSILKRGEVIGQSVSPLLTKYQERKAQVGEQQAGEEFKTGLQPILQNLVQQRVITPEQAKQYANATPAQAESVLQSTAYGRKQILDAAKLKQIQASTEADVALKAEREARTKEILQGKPGRTPSGKASGTSGTGIPGGVGSDTFQDTTTGQRYIINKRTGQAWEAAEDGTFKSIPLANVPAKVAKIGSIGTMGSIESRFTQRVLLSANEALKDLENVSQLPITVSSGVFGGRTQGPGLLDATKEVLANTMTQEDTQLYNTMSTGFQRSLAAIEAAGLMPTGSLTHQMDAVIFKEGDTNLTKMSKLAQVRQIVDAGLEVMESNPRLSDSEKNQAKKIRDGLEKAVPFTQQDVTKWMVRSQKNPSLTLKDVMGKRAQKAPAAEKKPMEFATEADAVAAEKAGTLKKGTKVTIGGRSGTWQ